MQAAEYVTIGELVRLTGARYSTLKHYTEEDILPFEQEEENLTRRYKRTKAIERIQWVKQMKDDGLSISQTKKSLESEQRIAWFHDPTGF